MQKIAPALLLLAINFNVLAQKKYIDQMAIDKATKPGDDFFEYANGAWLKANEIPATETGWGVRILLHNQIRQRLQQLIIETASKKNPLGSRARQLQDFYNSGMDTVAINRLGIQPVWAHLKRIEALQDKAEIVDEVIAQYASGMTTFTPLFSLVTIPDPVSNDNAIISLSQGGIGLPEKSFYLNEDEKSQLIRTKYRDYLQHLLQVGGVPPTLASTNAQAVLQLETNLAKGARTAVENRDIQRTLNYFTPEELTNRFPLVALNTLLEKLTSNSKKILVKQPEFFDTLNIQLSATPFPVWKDYLKLKVLANAAPYLSHPFVKAHFDFYTTALSGKTQMKPRSEQIINVIDSPLLGELLGKLYIEKYFTEDTKKRIDGLVQTILTTFAERIASTDWMTDSTKEKALQKLSLIRRRIAYPDQWRDYSSLTFSTNYFENVRAASAFDFKYRMSLVGKPIDRNRWISTPPTLNAYYSFSNNAIEFPAGILSFPLFDQDADDAVNYGGIGTIIGHEISHGFDDQGSQFDASGKFKNWWTKTDKENFTQKGNALARQFDQYLAIDTLHVNGRLTLGENIADLCGVTVAYQAFKKTPQGQSNQLIDGLTPDQRFFLSYAATWRYKQKSESLRTQVLTDPHSPVRFRVNGPLSNLEAFYRSFNITEGDKMWRPVSERIVIW